MRRRPLPLYLRLRLLFLSLSASLSKWWRTAPAYRRRTGQGCGRGRTGGTQIGRRFRCCLASQKTFQAIKCVHALGFVAVDLNLTLLVGFQFFCAHPVVDEPSLKVL